MTIRLRTMKVRDIPPAFKFVTDPAEVSQIRHRFGGQHFDSYFVQYQDGAIITVYGMESTDPRQNRTVHRLLLTP